MASAEVATITNVELDDAAAAMSANAAEPLSPELSAQLLARANSQARPRRAARLRAWFVRRLRVPVALALAVVVFGGAVLVWPEGRNSSATLNYDGALVLLQSRRQRVDSYSSAVAVVWQGIRYAVDTLKGVAADPTSPACAARAVEELSRLRAIVFGRRPWSTRHVDADLLALAAAATRGVDPAQRQSALGSLVDVTVAGVLALRRMASDDPNAMDGRARCEAWLEQALAEAR